MNYLKEIQILKNELALPLQKAKTLLEQTAGDIPRRHSPLTKKI